MPFRPKYYLDKIAGYDRYEQSLVARARLDDGITGCLFCSKSEYKIRHKAVCGAENELDIKQKGIVNKKVFRCSRSPGHKGYHVACGPKDHALFIWKKL